MPSSYECSSEGAKASSDSRLEPMSCIMSWSLSMPMALKIMASGMSSDSALT